jgi:hypothetical protein
VPFLSTTAWSTMTESVGNETIEIYWCFSSRNWHWPNVITWHDIKKNGSIGCVLCLCYYKNKPLMVNFKFAKFHCYQQIQSFLVTPYFLHCKNFVILPLHQTFFFVMLLAISATAGVPLLRSLKDCKNHTSGLCLSIAF